MGGGDRRSRIEAKTAVFTLLAFRLRLTIGCMGSALIVFEIEREGETIERERERENKKKKRGREKEKERERVHV